MFEDQYPDTDPEAVKPYAYVAEWKALLPEVAEHFGMGPEDKRAALESAWAEPYRALTCYRAIVNSLRRG